MDTFQLIMRVVLPVLYGVSAAMYITYFIDKEHLSVKRSAAAMLASTLLLHIIFLGLRAVANGHVPLSNIPEALSTCVAMIVIVYLYLEWSMRDRSLGAFIIPVVTILQIISSLLLPEGKELPEILKSGWLEIHVSVTLMAYAAFAIGCVSSLMYVFLFDEVRAKHLGFFYNRLPPLVTLDSLNHRTASIGFLLLTAGIVSGALWSSQAWGTFWRWDPKLTAALITWFIYAIHLYVRFVAGWAGKRASYFSIIGFLLALVTFIVVGIVQPGKHGF